jgi:hypothetical protein
MTCNETKNVDEKTAPGKTSATKELHRKRRDDEATATKQRTATKQQWQRKDRRNNNGNEKTDETTAPKTNATTKQERRRKNMRNERTSPKKARRRSYRHEHDETKNRDEPTTETKQQWQ